MDGSIIARNLTVKPSIRPSALRILVIHQIREKTVKGRREQNMIELKSVSLLDRILNLWPPRRKRKKAELWTAIKYLVEHPEAPCRIGQVYIPNGCGSADYLL